MERNPIDPIIEIEDPADAEAFLRRVYRLDAAAIERGLNALAEAVLADSPPELDPDGLGRA